LGPLKNSNRPKQLPKPPEPCPAEGPGFGGELFRPFKNLMTAGLSAWGRGGLPAGVL